MRNKRNYFKNHITLSIKLVLKLQEFLEHVFLKYFFI